MLLPALRREARTAAVPRFIRPAYTATRSPAGVALAAGNTAGGKNG
jgi:hypothetical protein